MRVAIVGAHGRMGRFTQGLLEHADGFEVVAALDRDDDLADLARSGAELGLELTVAGQGFAHGMALLEAGLRPVIGTSGVTVDENERLDRAARERGLGGLVVPNFSLGACLLARAAELVAPHLRGIEIVERHHERKRDAPSGTALELARRSARARGGSAAGEASESAIPIRSLRLPGSYAHHALLCAGEGETLTLSHDMAGPEAFGPGILLALRHARTAVGVGRGLELALGWA